MAFLYSKLMTSVLITLEFGDGVKCLNTSLVHHRIFSEETAVTNFEKRDTIEMASHNGRPQSNESEKKRKSQILCRESGIELPIFITAFN